MKQQTSTQQSGLVTGGPISGVQARRRTETTSLHCSNLKINIKSDKKNVFSLHGK